MIFTLVIDYDLNNIVKRKKGKDSWAVVVYQEADTFNQAVQEVNRIYDSPLILFACEGRQTPLRGYRLDKGALKKCEFSS